METALDAERKHDVSLRVLLIIWIFLTNETFQFSLQTVTEAGFFCSGKQEITQGVVSDQRHVKVSCKYIRILERLLLLAGNIFQHRDDRF